MKNPITPIIFIVDENRVYARLVEEHLKVANYCEIITFQSIEECYEYLEIQPDIIITEFQFSKNKIQGYSLLKTIKEKNTGIDIIFLTTNSDVETAIKAIRSGATEYIVKSKYAPVKLMQKVNALVKYKQELMKNSSIRKKLITSVGFLLVLMGCLVFYYTHK